MTGQSSFFIDRIILLQNEFSPNAHLKERSEGPTWRWPSKYASLETRAWANHWCYLAQTPLEACRGGVIPARYSTGDRASFRYSHYSTQGRPSADHHGHRLTDAPGDSKRSCYKAALAELDEQTRTSWQERLAPEPKSKRDGKYPAEASELFKADATSLKVYLDTFALPECVNQLICAEDRSVFRTQVLDGALNCDKLERLGRYEVQLDRKLERMLATLLRLQEFCRSNKVR